MDFFFFFCVDMETVGLDAIATLSRRAGSLVNMKTVSRRRDDAIDATPASHRRWRRAFFFFSEPVGDSASSPLLFFFFFFFFSEDASALFRFFVGAELTTPGGADPSRGSLVELGKKRARMSRGWSLPL